LRVARARRRRGVVVEGAVVLGRGVRFDLARGARVVLGAGCALGDGCRLHLGPSASVTVGAATLLGDRCVISAQERVTIGARCLLADEVVLADAGPRFDDVERPVREQGLSAAAIVLGDGVRVGPGAALLRGVTVGAGALVAAHAVVTRDVPPGASADGVPAHEGPRPPAR
jgi:acetyltransferase-like isoleucine patch superfamily enzyme